MAIDSTLGVRPIDTGFLRDISRQQSAMLEQLGAQVRSDVTQIQTNRQLQGFSQAVQGIDPTSKGYAQQIIGAISSYPLAAQSPLGGAVINQLGAAHSLWQQEQAQGRRDNAMLDRQAKTAWLEEANRTRPFGTPPVTMDQYPGAGGGSATPSGSGTPSIPATNSGGGLGKLTSYGYSSDPYGDSASLGRGKYAFPTGAWNNRLKPGSFAASPDVEAELRAAGVRPGQAVSVQLSNGQMLNGTWDDRTMQDEQAIRKFGKPLRGRWDFYSPDGVSKLDGAQVVGFRPAQDLGSPMSAGSQQASIPATNAPMNNLGAQIQQKQAELRSQGVPQHMAESIMDQFVKGLTQTGTPKTSLTWQGYGKIDPDTGQPQWTQNPLSKSNNQLPPLQQQELSDLDSERTGLQRKLQDAEAKLQEAGAMWETAGSFWDPETKKPRNPKASSADQEKAVALFDKTKQMVESQKKGVDKLRKDLEELDKKRRRLRGGGSAPATPAEESLEPVGQQPVVAQGASWKLDPKTGMKWEVGSDGKLTGRYVPKS